jgi:PIN domain nuclease of toxin-antitoxin system
VKLLLDTHALVWFVKRSKLLSPPALNAIVSTGNQVLVSVVSPWEMAIKVGLGKWPDAEKFLNDFESAIATEGFSLLPITVHHVRTAGLNKSTHRDPFDRLLAAQAAIEGLTLVSGDPQMQSLGAAVLW